MPSSEKANAFYPIGLNLQGQTILIVGAGHVAARKLARLLKTNCQIMIVSPNFSEAVTALTGQSNPTVTMLTSEYKTNLLDEIRPKLVFACTNDLTVNRQIATDANQRQIWVNSATEGIANSDFIVPSLLEYDDLQIALFSGGVSPLFIRQLRESLESQLGEWVTPYLEVLREVRETIQSRIADESERKRLNEAVLADETLLQQVRNNTVSPSGELAEAVLQRILKT